MERRNQGSDAIALCREVAINEQRAAQDYLGDIQRATDPLLAVLESVNGEEAAEGCSSEEVSTNLGGLRRNIKVDLGRFLDDIEFSLNQKRKSLDRFTVALFGRTMSGKSTLREALTEGDGCTIGKGAQRSTREITEYLWHDLRFLDTPGIGAYGGAKDKELALTALDESDLVLFLLSSDSIQEDSFKGMEEVYWRNKPTIFILNAKRDLTKEVYLNQFLREPNKILGLDVMRGHYERIRFLAKELHDIRSLSIIPVHAQAAFLSSRPDKNNYFEQLEAASNIRDVAEAIEEEASMRGPVRRIQTTLDCIICSAGDLVTYLTEKAETISVFSEAQRGKYAELDFWFEGYKAQVERRIEYFVAELLEPLRSCASSFVDENLEKRKVKELWDSEVKGVDIDGRVEEFIKIIQEELQTKLIDFQRQVEFELDLMESFEISAPKRRSPWDYRRTISLTSTGIGALGLLATDTGMAAIAVALAYFGVVTIELPPLGVPILVLSAFLALLSMFLPKRESRIHKRKLEATQKLREDIDVAQSDICLCMNNWFDENIVNGLMSDIRAGEQLTIASMRSIAEALTEASRRCEETIADANKRLILRVALFCNYHLDETNIQHVVRVPGGYVKAVCKGVQERRVIALSVGEALNESVVFVENGPKKQMIVQALAPAVLETSAVTLSRKRTSPDYPVLTLRPTIARVTVPRSEIENAEGPWGINAATAGKLLGVKVEIEPEV